MIEYRSLTTAAKDCKGDTKKYLPMSEYFEDTINSNYEKDSDSRHLHDEGLIIVCANGMFKVTRKGQYYAMKSSNLPDSQFAIVNYNEAMKLAYDLLMKLCNNYYDFKPAVEIAKISLNTYGEKITPQIIDLLFEEDLIDYDDTDHKTIRISSKGILKVVEKLLLD